MILIQSLLPNPVGRDTDGEWIRLINDGNQIIALTDLQLKDSQGKSFDLSSLGNLGGGEVLELSHSLTSIDLNNDGDSLFLYRANQLTDQLTYSGPVGEDEIIFAANFYPRFQEKTTELANMAESGVLDSQLNITGLQPIFIGLVPSLVFAALAILLKPYFFKEDDEG